MKFAGLVLICASSCLGLILPAIGFVQFPNFNANYASSPTALAADPSQNVLPASSPTFPTSVQVPLNSFPNPGLDPYQNPQTYQNSQYPSLNNGFQPAPNPIPPANEIAAPTPTVASTSKLGMGLWLLLGPICLFGLVLWTFSPNPSSSNKSSFIKRAV